MKKAVLLFMVMWLCGMTLMAAPVSRQQAQQIAAQFLNGKNTSHRVSSASEMQAEVVFGAVNGTGMPYLYAVNIGIRVMYLSAATTVSWKYWATAIAAHSTSVSCQII